MFMYMYMFCVVAASFCKAFHAIKVNQLIGFMLDGKLANDILKSLTLVREFVVRQNVWIYSFYQ